MAGDVILGIHSNVRNRTIDPETGKAVDPAFDDGHGWLSVTRDGVTTNYGLWPDSSRAGDNGEGNDIREGMEDRDTAAASRYYRRPPPRRPRSVLPVRSRTQKKQTRKHRR